MITRYDESHERLLDRERVRLERPAGSDRSPLKVNLPGKLDLDTLTAHPRGDWFLLSGRTSGQATGPALFAYAFNRKFGRFGDWEVTSLKMPSLALSDEYALAAGAEFIVAAATDQRDIFRYHWDRPARQWRSNTLALPTAGAYSVGAFERYFTLAIYFKGPNEAVALPTIPGHDAGPGP